MGQYLQLLNIIKNYAERVTFKQDIAFASD